MRQTFSSTIMFCITAAMVGRKINVEPAVLSPTESHFHVPKWCLDPRSFHR